jgi:hypothetical protein
MLKFLAFRSNGLPTLARDSTQQHMDLLPGETRTQELSPYTPSSPLWEGEEKHGGNRHIEDQ